MGCGKSKFGKKLSTLLNYEFVDLDILIEKKTKRTIPDIFLNSGEESFRKIERSALQETFNFDVS